MAMLIDGNVRYFLENIGILIGTRREPRRFSQPLSGPVERPASKKLLSDARSQLPGEWA